MVADRKPYQPQGGYRPTAGRDSGPSYAQVLQDVRNAGMISTSTSVEVVPCESNEYLCIIRAETVMPPLREGDSPRHYSGIGAAYPRKNGANVIHGVSNPSFYMHIAESRAKKRAWMDALGRGDGLEENIREDVFQERTTLTRRDDPPPVWKISESDAEKLSRVSGKTVSEIQSMSKQEVSILLESLRRPKAITEEPAQNIVDESPF